MWSPLHACQLWRVWKASAREPAGPGAMLVPSSRRRAPAPATGKGERHDRSSGSPDGAGARQGDVGAPAGGTARGALVGERHRPLRAGVPE
ncbi:hypothetical protein D3C72_1538920 [compost metagenome]